MNFQYTPTGIAPFLALLLLIAGAACSYTSESRDARVHLTTSPLRPSIAPDGRRVVFGSSCRSGSDVYVAYLDNSGKMINLTNSDAFEGWPSFSPTGDRVVFARERDRALGSSLFLMDCDGNNQIPVTESDFYDAAPTFSPDGRFILFARATRLRDYASGGRVWDQWDLYLIRTDGTHERRLTHEESVHISAPQFSTDGKLIVYAASGRNTNPTSATPELLVLGTPDPDEQAGRPMTVAHSGDEQASVYVLNPIFLPHERRIAFSSSRDSPPGSPWHYEIWEVDIDGSNLKRLTHTGAVNLVPTYAQDGSLYYLHYPSADRDDHVELKRFAPGGGTTLLRIP